MHRRWASGLRCDWRWNMSFSPHSRIWAIITAMAPYAVPPEPKNSKLQFQWKESWHPFSGAEKAFSWSTSCLLAQQLMPLHIVTPWHGFNEPFKTKGGECCHTACACSTTTCGPILRMSPLRFWKNSSGIYLTIRCTVRTSRPGISTCFFIYRNISLGKSSTMMMRYKKKSWHSSKVWWQTSMTRGNRSWFQDLINVWTMPWLCWKIKLCTGNSFTMSLL